MPGIRSAEMVNKDWPRTHHDKIATGFSPLVCGMKKAPVQWASITIPGRLDWLRVLSAPGLDDKLLVSDSHLRLFTSSGEEIWSRSAAGALWYYGDLHGDGRLCLLMGAGRRLVELDTATGSTIWTYEFEPSHVDLVVRVADVLPDQPGLEAAVFLVHSEEGSLLRFPPNAKPQFVWRRPVVTPGAFNERYDHGNGIELDLSQRDAPVIWNLRRYRCRGIDARTGEVISTLEYKIGGEPRRNYGEWALGQARDGGRLAVVLAESVQLHTHAIRLHRKGQNELAWQHYYGEVYRDAPGVALSKLAIADLDGDSVTDVAYSVRDPAQDFRSFLRVRNAETGATEFDLPDHWGAAVLQAAGPDPTTLMLGYAAPHGATPTQGNLEAFVTTGTWPARKVASVVNATLLRPERGHPESEEFFTRETDSKGIASVRCYGWTASEITIRHELTGEPFRSSSLRAILRNSNGSEVFVLASNDGELILASADAPNCENSRFAVPVHRRSARPTSTAMDGPNFSWCCLRVDYGFIRSATMGRPPARRLSVCDAVVRTRARFVRPVR